MKRMLVLCLSLFAAVPHANAMPQPAFHTKGGPTGKPTGTLNKSTCAFFFNPRGLMGGLGLQGSKITRIRP